MRLKNVPGSREAIAESEYTIKKGGTDYDKEKICGSSDGVRDAE